MSVRLVFTTLPDAEVAGKLARQMVELGLAACVNVLAPCQSVYRWQGEVESTSEIPLFFKSTAANYTALEARIRQLHPYALPEIIALPLSHGLPAYLNWVAAETIQ